MLHTLRPWPRQGPAEPSLPCGHLLSQASAPLPLCGDGGALRRGRGGHGASGKRGTGQEVSKKSLGQIGYREWEKGGPRLCQAGHHPLCAGAVEQRKLLWSRGTGNSGLRLQRFQGLGQLHRGALAGGEENELGTRWRRGERGRLCTAAPSWQLLWLARQRGLIQRTDCLRHPMLGKGGGGEGRCLSHFHCPSASCPLSAKHLDSLE